MLHTLRAHENVMDRAVSLTRSVELPRDGSLSAVIWCYHLVLLCKQWLVPRWLNAVHHMIFSTRIHVQWLSIVRDLDLLNVKFPCLQVEGASRCLCEPAPVRFLQWSVLSLLLELLLCLVDCEGCLQVDSSILHMLHPVPILGEEVLVIDLR